MNSDAFSLLKNGRRVVYKPPFQTFDQFLVRQAKRYGKKPAIIFNDFNSETQTEISYRKLEKLTGQLASRLERDWKLRPGDRLSFAFTNTPEIILLNYAAWRSGLVTAPLTLKSDMIDRKIYKLKFADAKLLFTRSDPKIRSENLKVQKALPGLKIIEIPTFAELEKSLNALSGRFKNSLNTKKDCLILFTSGTTANPKGVRLTLESLFANAQSIAKWLQFNEEERFQILLPLHHINSVTFTNTTILAGGTVILSPRYSKSRFWEIMAKQGATGASIVPTIAYDLLSEKKRFKVNNRKLKNVRRIQIGSAPVQPNVVEAFMKAYKIPLIQGYGQTETSLRSTGVPMNLTAKQYAHIRKINSLGTELRYTNVAVLDRKGRELKAGEIGEICVRGPIIMKGYLKSPKANREAFAYRWFHSGDTGYWRKLYGKKYFFLKGRTKEIIKKGGVLISPLAIENVLLEKYSQLQKVYAVGFPDRRLGQEIGILVVSKDKNLVRKILDNSKQGKIKNLSKLELPKSAIRVKEQELPKTSTGKIQRIKIKELFGLKLLIKFRSVAETKTHLFRLIGPEETAILKEAQRINNLRWGSRLRSSLSEFQARAENGILIGAFESNQLLGTVSAMLIQRKDLEALGRGVHWTDTWNGISGNGKLSRHNHKGDTLICVAISTKPQPLGQRKKPLTDTSRKKLTQKTLMNYLKSQKDPVIRFHRRSKAGLKKGARLVKVIPNGRPKDKDALGFNLLMKYPEISKQPKINPNATIGTQLIESAFLLAFGQKIRNVFVYSRPAHLGRFFRK